MKPGKNWFQRLLSQDRRRAVRHIAPQLVAYYWNGDTPVAHVIRDISSTGMYLLTEERWYPGTLVMMTLQRTDISTYSRSGRSISVQAKVVRWGPDGVGFKLVFPETGESKRVQGLLEAADQKTFSDFVWRYRNRGEHAQSGLEETSMKKPERSSGGWNASRRGFFFEKYSTKQALGAFGNWKFALRDEGGQALVLMLLCMTCVLGFVGFATDVGTLLRAKRVMQTAADSGAIAGAAELGYTDLTPQAAALAATAQNGIANGSNGATVTVNIPPLYASAVHRNNNYVEVVVSQSQPTFFMRLFKLTSMTVSARAVATLGKSNGCIYTLGPSGTDLDVSGSAALNLPNCGIVDDSSSGNGLDVTGNASLNAKSIGVAGGASDNGNVTPPPITGMVPASDPLAFLTAPNSSSCSAYTAGSSTINPGCYSGLSISGTVNLNPGVYVINGDLSITGNASVTGTGVTFYLMGSANLSGTINLNLAAPTSGVYNGILFFQARGNANPAVVTANSGSTLEGILYFPSAALTVTGNSGSTIYADLIAQSLAINGNASFQDYALVNGSSVLTAARLVE